MTTSRRAHVYRIYPTDENGKITDVDVWVDLMRIDHCVFSEPRGSVDGAVTNRGYTIKWGDNTVAMGGPPDAPARRVYGRLTVVQPPDKGQDPNDPGLSRIDIPLINKTWFSFRGSSQGFGHQSVEFWFWNSKEPTGRKFTKLRITNNDLKGRDKDFFPEVNVGDPQPPVPRDQQVGWGDYVKALLAGETDDSQYVDVEVTDRFKVRFPPSPPDHTGELVGLSGQIITYVLLNQQHGSSDLGVEDLFDSPKDSVPSEQLTNKPGGFWRTDPFQAIVNVSWGGLAVEFGDGAGPPVDGSGGGA